MNRFNSIEKLLELTAGKRPFISIYLDTRSNENGKKTFDVFVKKQISEQLNSLPADSQERKYFESDIERIEQFLDGIDPSVQGVAVFACAATGFFKTYEFHVPFDENLFFVFDRPHLYPLIKLISQNRRFAVAQADTNSAHIYVVKSGEVFSRDDIQNVKTNRSEVGGWSQMRYQRHIENFHKQHAKEVVGELEKLVRDERLETLVLAGDDTVIIPLLKDEMSKELAETIAGTVSLNVNAPEHEVVEEAEKVVRRHDTLKDMERIRQLEEQDHDGGLGVTRLEKVLAALLNGQVQELYIASDFDSINYNVGEVNKLFKDYAPGLDEDLPSAKRTGLVIDEVLRLAAQTADDICFVEDPNLLKEAGGVGALLRYQAKGVNV